MTLTLALYQPDIPQNVGSALRLCACLGMRLSIIEPCGFPWNDKKIRVSAMDYFDHADIRKFVSWDDFKDKAGGRIVLMTTKTDQNYTGFTFQDGDILLAGRESAGVPENVVQSCDALITIAMKPGMRSLNVINASAMVAGEALRQIDNH